MDYLFFFFSSRRRHTRFDCDWSSDVCSSDLGARLMASGPAEITIVGSGVAGMLLARALPREGREGLMIERGAFRDHPGQLKADAADEGHSEEGQIPTAVLKPGRSHTREPHYAACGPSLPCT